MNEGTPLMGPDQLQCHCGTAYRIQSMTISTLQLIMCIIMAVQLRLLFFSIRMHYARSQFSWRVQTLTQYAAPT